MSQHGDFDEFLRRLLREEADTVHPSDDGLERIRARLTRPRPAPVAWLMAVFSGTGRRVQGAARSVAVWLQTLPGTAQTSLRSPGGGRSRWRSPAVLAACATIMVAVGVLALTPLPQQAVSGTAALFRSVTGGGHAGGTAGTGGGQADGGSGPQPAPGGSSSSPPGKNAHGPASPSPTPSPSPSSSPSPTASPSPTPGPTPSPSPTPSCPSASPSPSPSPTPNPSSGACSTPSTNPTTGPTDSPAPRPASG